MEAPGEHDALWTLVRFEAGRIASGKVGPYDGASWISRMAYPRIEREGDLRVFVGLTSEWDDHPPHRPEIDRRIVEEAKRLVAKTELHAQPAQTSQVR